MIRFSLAFLFGILILTTFRDLPHWLWAVCVIPAVCFAIKFPRYIVLLGIIIGFLWALGHAYLRLYPELDRSLEGVDLYVQGLIISIPAIQDRSMRFELKVTSATQIDNNENITIPNKVRLNWYGDFPVLQIGEQWHLRVRLKRPWGFANPGGFDYEKWLFEQGIRATGYVRNSELNQRIEVTKLSQLSHFVRAWLNKQFQDVELDKNTAVIKALVLGEKNEMSEKRWEILTATGTNHLLAISGLHISLVSGFVFFIVLQLWKLSETLCLLIAAQRIAAIAGIIASVLYAMLAGFAIPTQRAVVMVSVVLLAIYYSKTIRPWNILAIALLAVLVWDPFSVLSPGFWLSFLAVAIIFYTIAEKQAKQSWIYHIGRMQLVLAVGLLPLTLVLFQQAALIAPIANMFAVPWVSFVVVPLVLLGSGLLILSQTLSAWVLQIAGYSVDVFWAVLTFLYKLPNANWFHAAPGWVLIPAGIAIILLLAPRGWPAKLLCIPLLSPLVFAPASELLDEDELRVAVLDVGQGLAVVLEHDQYVLVYDTGPKFSKSFNAGESVVLPYLLERGIDEIDMLVVSHADKDHAGGAQSLLSNIDVKRMVTSTPSNYKHAFMSECKAGIRWEWKGVHYQFLHPGKDMHGLSKNNGSCVLLVRHRQGSVLITGDIERPIERFLVENKPDLLDTDVLIVPHHGSNSSSTAAFIQTTSPEYAIFTTGYRNPYGFPNKKVIARYEEFGSALMNTASEGMITFAFLNQNGLKLHTGYREKRRRFWHSRF